LGIPFKARYLCHACDSVGFFGRIDEYYTPTKEDCLYEQMMQREMLHFARTGKPYTDSWKTYPTTTRVLDTINKGNNKSDGCEFISFRDVYILE
jgi:carboxylesterase type B